MWINRVCSRVGLGETKDDNGYEDLSDLILS